jgi:succinate dehydrogenase / fumarate reductase membrane anchor subunit
MSQHTHKSFRNELGRVRGLGAAKEGAHHWWVMKITSLALIPLGLWFVISVLGILGADYTSARAWIAQPGAALAMILFLGFALHHSAHGIQVVMEDYIHTPWRKTLFLILNKLIHVFLAAAGFYAVLSIAFHAS